MVKELKAGLAVLTATSALLGTCNCRNVEKTEQGARAVKVQRVNLSSTIIASGTVKPQVGAQVKVGPRISGLLTHLHVKVGTTVEAGQVLAELEHADLDAAVRDAEASVKETEAKRKLAKAQYERRNVLGAEGIISREDLDVASQTLSASEAALQSAMTRLDSARIVRGYAVVRAPISGTVTSITTQEGETVAASFAVPTFVTIVDLSRLQVETYVDEVDIGRVTAGQEATFTVDAYPSQNFEGSVQAIVPQAIIRTNVVSYVVLVSITSKNASLLRPEMTASVKIVAGTQRDALVIPAEGVRRDDVGRTYVAVLQGGRAVRRPVSLGMESDGVIQVKAGLSEGENVLLKQAASREDQR